MTEKEFLNSYCSRCNATGCPQDQRRVQFCMKPWSEGGLGMKEIIEARVEKGGNNE